MTVYKMDLKIPVIISLRANKLPSKYNYVLFSFQHNTTPSHSFN